LSQPTAAVPATWVGVENVKVVVELGADIDEWRRGPRRPYRQVCVRAVVDGCEPALGIVNELERTGPIGLPSSGGRGRPLVVARRSSARPAPDPFGERGVLPGHGALG
jgi:hypothetical protein